MSIYIHPFIERVIEKGLKGLLLLLSDTSGARFNDSTSRIFGSLFSTSLEAKNHKRTSKRICFERASSETGNKKRGIKMDQSLKHLKKPKKALQIPWYGLWTSKWGKTREKLNLPWNMPLKMLSWRIWKAIFIASSSQLKLSLRSRRDTISGTNGKKKRLN